MCAGSIKACAPVYACAVSSQPQAAVLMSPFRPWRMRNATSRMRTDQQPQTSLLRVPVPQRRRLNE